MPGLCSTRTVLGKCVSAFALITSLSLAPARVAAGYQPQTPDEKGIWMVMAEEERRLKESNFVIQDAALNAYVREVFCRTVGQGECAAIRIYVMRTPYFNASMAPNGMMQVWSGMFLRTRDEAQLAAVLAHEYTHYQRRHSLRLFRDVRRKTDAMSFLSFPLAFVGYGAGAIANLAMLASVYGFSRDMEREADANSVLLLSKAGYDPMSAARIWNHMLIEREATASQRKRKPRGDDPIFGSHPTTRERMIDLQKLAEAQPGAGSYQVDRARYRAALAPWWAGFVDDQIKLNDFGGTELLLADLAQDGWTSELLYARGELYRARGRPDDLSAAAGFYRAAIAAGAAPVEAQRGLGLALMRSGDKAGGAAALKAYVAVRPEADDAAILTSLAGA